MKTSEKIDKLMPALAAAYEEMGAAFKTGRNPHFKSKYADLPSVDAASRPVLAKHGLMYTQGVVEGLGGLAMETTIIHGARIARSQKQANPAEAIKELKKACDDEGLDFGLVEDFVQMKRGALITELNSADIAGLKARVMNEKDKFRKDK